MSSKGEVSLAELLAEEYPYYRIIPQHTIKYKKRTLYLDFYIPALRLAFEVDGRQHSQFVKFFHKDYWNYKDAKYRDTVKEEWCASEQVTLIRLNYTERLTKDSLRQKIQAAVSGHGSRGSTQQSQDSLPGHHPQT